MTARAPIILFAVVLVLLGYIYFFERGRPGRSELDSRSGFLLQAVVRERITRVRIASGDDRTVLLREGEGFDETWRLQVPVQAPANLDAVEDFLRNWEFATPIRTLEEPTSDDLESFGLRQPKATVRFEMGRSSVGVSLGGGLPVDGGGYVRVNDDDRVMVVDDDVVALFERSAEYFEADPDAGEPDLDDLIDAAAVTAD